MNNQKVTLSFNTKLWILCLIAWIFWLIVSWFAKDLILDARVKTLIQETTLAINQQASNISEGLSLSLNKIHGIQIIVARDAEVLGALSHFGAKSLPAALTIEQRKRIWSDDTQLRRVSNYLKLVSTSTDEAVVYLMNAAGDCIASSNADQPASFVGSNYVSREYFKDAMAGINGYQYANGRTTQIPGLYFSVPVTVNGKIIGAVIAKVNLHTLTHFINHTNTFITDNHGVIILSSDEKFLLHSAPDVEVVHLTKEERMDHYLRDDFLALSISPVINRWGKLLVHFDKETEPLILTNQALKNNLGKVYVFRKLNKLAELKQDSFRQYLLSGFAGLFFILLIRMCILYFQVQRLHAKQLKDSEQTLANILNMSPIAMRITVQRGERVAFYNPSYASLIKDPDHLGRNPKRYYVHEQEYEEVLNEIDQGKSVKNIQIELKIADNETLWVLASYMPLQYHDEAAILCWFYDINNIKKTEEALRKARQSAEAASRSKSDFLANMSHEIRTPMNAILGMSDILSETDLCPEQRKYVEIFQNAGNNLLELINDILDMSKVESGQLELDNENFSLEKLLEEIVNLQATRSLNKGLELVSLT